MLLFNRYEYNPQADIAGKGEFSRVYKAVDTSNHELVAIKIYKINDFSDHYRLVQDTQTIQGLEHAGLCRYIDIREIEKEDSFGEKEKLEVCITAFMNAGNLVTYYKEHNDPVVLKKLLLDALNGLSYLHQKGIIHGYIKPSNLLVTEINGEALAKITDFAMGISPSDIPPRNGTYPLLSVISYFSPEQLNATQYGIAGKVSFNTDLWSLAAVLYEALTGEPLIKIAVTDFPQTITAKITGFELPEKANSLPSPFKEFITLCLVKDAGARVKTVEEIVSLLAGKAAAGNILQLEEKPVITPRLPGTLLTTEEDNIDNTRIIALPKKDKTAPAAALPADGMDDHTRIIARAAAARAAEIKAKEENDINSTRIISKPAEQKLTDDSSDDQTQIIAKPENLQPVEDADDTRIISKPFQQSVTGEDSSDDQTQIIAKPENLQPVENTDDTRIISKPSAGTKPGEKPVTEDNSNEQTQLIAKPFGRLPAETTKKEDAFTDDTMIIPAPAGNTEPAATTAEDNSQQAETAIDQAATLPPQEETTPVDQTIIISSLNKEKQTGGTGSTNPPAEKGKLPDILIRRREKPVVLFNRYEYLPATDLIGKGGFSRVYKAYDKKLSRWVALKIYKTGEFSDRYSPIAEIKRVVNLDHSNICRYLDIEEIENENPFGENEKIQVCVMELLDSGNFADYYKANKNPEVLKKLIQDILNGLSYLHKNGIIHRDIKPGNILIKQTIEGPVAKITDFGISKNSEAENNNSSSALIVSIPYMAPEQLNAKKYGINEKISFNLDLWSLGVTIYEVVTGKVLFKNSEQDNSEQIMANIMAPELPEKLNDLPEPFKTIVSHCVIKNARERAARAEELMVLLHTTITEPANTPAAMASQAANTFSGAEKEAVVASHKETNNAETDATRIIAPPVTDTQKTINKARFSIADQEEQAVTVKETKKVSPLTLFITVSVLLFIAFVIFIKTCNQPAIVENAGRAQKNDTAHKKITAPVIPAADTAGAAKKKDTGAAHTSAVVAPPHTKEKKKEKPVEETHKREAEPTEKKSNNTATKYVLILTAENACNLKINSIDYGELNKSIPLKVYLVPGKYVIQCTSSTNSASTYNAKIEVTAEILGQVGKYKIPL